MVAADVRSANRSSCCSLIRFSTSPRAQYTSSYRVRASIALAGSEVTMKRGFGPLDRCSALATTRRVRLQLSSAWPPERGWGPVPQLGGQAGEVGKAAGGTATGHALGLGGGQV